MQQEQLEKTNKTNDICPKNNLSYSTWFTKAYKKVNKKKRGKTNYENSL